MGKEVTAINFGRMGNKWTIGKELSRTEKNMRDSPQKQADSVSRIPKPKSRIVDGAKN